MVFKAFPKIKYKKLLNRSFIDILVRKIQSETSLRTKIEEKTLRFFVNNIKNSQDDRVKSLKADGKQNISYLSSVRSDNGKDISNDKEDWIS